MPSALPSDVAGDVHPPAAQVGPAPGIWAGPVRRDPVFRGRQLDVLFVLTLVLYAAAVLNPQRSDEQAALGAAVLVPLVALWWVWRVRRSRGLSSRLVAVGFAVSSFAGYVIADSVVSVGVQWVAAMLLMLELGWIGPIGYTCALMGVTFWLHATSGSGLGRAATEVAAVALILALGVTAAETMRRARQLDLERIAALDQLELANTELHRRLATEHDLVLAQERARVATALHDGLGHRLTAIGMSLHFAERMRDQDPDRSLSELRTAREDATQALNEMRRVVRAMHPVATEADVPASLEALAQSFRSTGLEVTFTRGDVPIAREPGLLLLRFAQEGLTNVVRHSGADHAWLRLGRHDDDLVATLTDNGTAAGPVTPGFGIRSLRERAELLGGSLDAGPTDDGFRLTLLLPVAH